MNGSVVSGRETATDRLTRLLSLIPWVAAHPDGVDVGDVCERFGLSETELARDIDTVMMVGVYPFTPDTMIEAWITDGIVRIQFADAFARPLRLTSDEAVRLIAAARGLSSVPGVEVSGPLHRALDKLDRLIGGNGRADVEVDLGDASADVFAKLVAARDDKLQVQIDYPDSAGGAVQTRTIEPTQLFSNAGHWYVSGWCHHAQGPRVFRVDRIISAQATLDGFSHPDERSRDAVGFDDSLPQVEIEVDRPSAWLLESVPFVDRVDDATTVRLRLSIGSPQWLARLLLQLGEDARVITSDPSLDLGELVYAESEAILDRYR